MSSVKPIKLYSHKQGPNPWKVAIILEELGIPYENSFVDPAKIKEQPFVLVNPNGRVPAIEDPNTGIVLWESGAIINYLIETYDTQNKISYTSAPEKFQTMQWLMFQVSGQGPYFGQAAWFGVFHSEKIPSAIERYVKEMERVISVLDLHLSRGQGEERWLVGDKCTFADLSFVTWSQLVPMFEKEDKFTDNYPHYQAWMKKMEERPSVVKALGDKAKAMEAAE